MKCKLLVLLFAVLLLSGCKASVEGKEYILSNSTENAKDVATTVLFSESDAQITGGGATLRDGRLKITSPGEYRLCGSFAGGVDVILTKEQKATLILDNVQIRSSDSAAIYVVSADKVTISLADGTESTLSDGASYADNADAEPSACIYSADDLTIKGDGKLTIFARCKNAVETKNDLRIKSGSINISAAKNALKGKDSVQIEGGAINILSCKDGIQSDNEKEEGRGKVIITGGEITMSCEDDGIQATNEVSVANANIKIDAKDKKVNCDNAVTIADGCIQ